MNGVPRKRKLSFSSSGRSSEAASSLGAGISVSSTRCRIAVVGDLHGAWTEFDTEYFNRSDYELLLLTGDLGSGQDLRSGQRIARWLARLSLPTIVILGNNDALVAPELKAEFAVRQGIARVSQAARSSPHADADADAARESDEFRIPEDNVLCTAYSLERLKLGDHKLSLITARPYAMGGSELSFSEQLARFGIQSLEDSTRRLTELVDSVTTPDVLFLAHNGPTGMGANADSLWGRDFAAPAMDWGDADLAQAIQHAKQRGLRVQAVIAGHMHLQTRTGSLRPWQQTHDGTLFLNPARVPRIWRQEQHTVHHHVELTLASTLSAREKLVRQPA